MHHEPVPDQLRQCTVDQLVEGPGAAAAPGDEQQRQSPVEHSTRVRPRCASPCSRPARRGLPVTRTRRRHARRQLAAGGSERHQDGMRHAAIDTGGQRRSGVRLVGDHRDAQQPRRHHRRDAHVAALGEHDAGTQAGQQQHGVQTAGQHRRDRRRSCAMSSSGAASRPGWRRRAPATARTSVRSAGRRDPIHAARQPQVCNSLIIASPGMMCPAVPPPAKTASGRSVRYRGITAAPPRPSRGRQHRAACDHGTVPRQTRARALAGASGSFYGVAARSLRDTQDDANSGTGWSARLHLRVGRLGDSATRRTMKPTPRHPLPARVRGPRR